MRKTQAETKKKTQWDPQNVKPIKRGKNERVSLVRGLQSFCPANPKPVRVNPFSASDLWRTGALRKL